MNILRSCIIGVAFVGVTQAGIVINEIHYNSRPNNAQDEFVELYNSGDTPVDLSGWFFNDGFDFTFPVGTQIGVGGYVVVAKNPAALLERYGLEALGPFDGGLSGEGERIELRRADGSVADEVNYQDNFPWPTAAGGAGSSMELIHPDLDNDLGGSWRSSKIVVLPKLIYLPEDGPGWRWRAGTSEASSPINAWTEASFVEDGTWVTQKLPIGFGRVGTQSFNPPITGMVGNYTSCFFRNEFEIVDGEVPQEILLRYLLDDGMVVYINGSEVFRTDNMAAGQLAFDDESGGSGDENNWFETSINGGAAGLKEGTNVIAVHAFNTSLGSNDFGLNIELLRPEPDTEADPEPSAGLVNTVFSEVAPPFIRQVNHSPKQPTSGESTVITAKVTDPDGVASVTLEVQDVAPGAYVSAFLAKTTRALLSNPTAPRAENPAYEQNWASQLMTDDGIGADEVAGDGVYSAILESRPNRTLVRYRITVEDTGGESVRVPYADDERLNFAYFQYDGIPDYQTNVGTFSANEVQSIPVYHVLTTSANFNQAVAYNGSDQIGRDNYDARSEYNWNCTFVYEGKVYDNVKYRLRQRNARYSGSGKRSLKFRFNRGNHPAFRDMNGDKYAKPWKFLSTHKMLSSRSNYYTWGLFQATNHLMWNLTGTPAPYTHWGHFRIVQGAEEYTTQHVGDYYGMLLAMEEYDSRFLDSHDMEKRNLYKLISGRTNGKDVQRYQGAESVADASDFSTIINQLTPARDDNWLREHVNWDSWNRYHAVVDMIRHYDVRPNRGEHLKNRAYYFEASATNPQGRLNVLPWDSDTSWGPNWNDGMDFPKQAIFGSNQTNPVPRGDFGLEYFNTVRELRDLVWTEEQISLMIDPLAAKIDQLVPADRARWLGSPNGSQNYPPIEPRVADMKKFAFTGRNRDGSGEIWTGGNNAMPFISQDSGASGDFGRDAYLDALVADANLPAKPTITYSGDAGFPQDGLSFTSSDFSDPQGANTFQSMEWRLAQVTSLGGGVREIMAPGRIWSYQDNNIDEGVAWREVGFDDSGWKTGAAPLGFGRVNGINMATTTTSRIPTAYFRTTVNVTDLNLIESFLFKLLVDDGAAVYVNGQEAFRDGFDPDTVVGHNVFADSSGNESDFDEFEVNPDLFIEGENVIAIEVHNTSLGSNDMGFEMSLDAQEVLLPSGENPSFEWATTWESGELTTFNAEIAVPSVARVGRTYRARVRHEDTTGRWSNWSEPVEFMVGNPSIQSFLDGIVISKIMYHPLPPSASELAAIPSLEEGDFEWIEIMNIGVGELDLNSLRFTKGIEFDFVNGSKKTIGAGERLLVVANVEAFNLRHGFANTPDFVLGEFSNRLSNGGERVKLSFGAGTLVREVRYGDQLPWPELADGSGASLVWVDGFGETAGDWRPSVGENGAPAVDDGLPFTGDLNLYALRSLPEVSVVELGGEFFAEVSFDRQVNADRARILVQSSADLEAWSESQVTKVSEVFGEGETSRVTFRTNDPITSARGFYRLKLQLK